MFPSDDHELEAKEFWGHITSFEMEPDGLSPVEGAGPRQGVYSDDLHVEETLSFGKSQIVGSTIFATETWSKKKSSGGDRVTMYLR